MEIVKELSSISLAITEPEYRQRPELSYSTLSTYETLGFSGLDHLFDKKESSSLTLGSVVDTILTGGEDEFKSLYTVLDINVTDSGIDICKSLVNLCLPFETFEEIPESIVSDTAKSVGFWQNDKWDKKRYSEVLKTGNVAEYYNALRSSDKTIISCDTYQTALAMVRALRESPATAGYFADNDELSPIRRYYQLKFAANFEGVGYRNMADLLVADYEKKVIWPIDLKTSMSTAEWDFTLEDYRFIICNPKTLTPLVWEFPLTKSVGTLIDDDGKEIRDPFEIGKELQGYLNLRPPVPNGINKDGVNIIKCITKK